MLSGGSGPDPGETETGPRREGDPSHNVMRKMLLLYYQ